MDPLDQGLGLDSRLSLSDADQRTIAVEAADLGYRSLWTPNRAAKDVFDLCGAWYEASGLMTGVSVLPRQTWTIAQLASGPIVAIALDITEGSAALNEELRLTAERILKTLPAARLACLNVLKLGRVTLDKTLDEEGNNKYVDRLVTLKHWASPLKLDESRLTAHVLAAVDPAAAILEFAQANNVDHIVIGARQNSLVRTLLGSVSARVAAEAPAVRELVQGALKALTNGA